MLKMSNNRAIVSVFIIINHCVDKLFLWLVFVANLIGKTIKKSNMIESCKMIEIMIESYYNVIDFVSD